jgi:hypothetical protein
MVLLENFGAAPFTVNLGISIVMMPRAYCHERLHYLWSSAFQSSGKRAILKGPRVDEDHRDIESGVKPCPRLSN